jgi:hypothetical protein
VDYFPPLSEFIFESASTLITNYLPQPDLSLVAATAPLVSKDTPHPALAYLPLEASQDHTFALAQRLQGSGVVAHVVHPGTVATGLIRESGLIGVAWRLMAPFMRTEERGADAPLDAALARRRALDSVLVGKVDAATRKLALEGLEGGLEECRPCAVRSSYLPSAARRRPWACAPPCRSAWQACARR